MPKTNPDLRAFRAGDRVQAHPATDAWMQGDRYGAVVKIGRRYAHVKMDASGRRLRFAPIHLTRIDG